MNQSPNELVVYQCKLHRGIFLLPVLSALMIIFPALAYLWLMSNFMSKLGPFGQTIHFPWMIFVLPGLAVGASTFLATLITYLKSEVVLTHDRLRFKTGWLSVGSTEILLTKIETITLWEPLVGRIVGYGTVAVTGTGGAAFRLRFLPNPKHLHGLLQTLINNAQTSQPSRSLPPAPSLAYDESRYMPKG